jgi:hypothetical protein
MTLLESIVVMLVVAAAFILSARYLFRSVSGKNQRCAKGEDCPLAGGCACTPDAAQSGQAPDGCPIATQAHVHHGRTS